MASQDPVHFSRENKLLRKEHLFRRNRSASITLATLAFLGFAGVFIALSTSSPPAAHTATAIYLSTTLFNALLWSLLAWLYQAKVLHCESIRHYRAMLSNRASGERITLMH